MGSVETSLLIGLLTSNFTRNVFGFDDLTSYLLYFALLAYIHVRVAGRARVPTWLASLGSAIMGNSLIDYIVMPTAVVIAVVSLYFFTLRDYFQNQTLVSALRPYYDAGTANLAFFKQALAYDASGTMETRERLVLAASQMAQAQPAYQELKKQFFDLASNEMIKEAQGDPLNARPKAFLASLYLHYGMYDQAIEWFKNAHDNFSHNRDILRSLARAYFLKGDIVQGAATIQEAFDEDPAFAIQELQISTYVQQRQSGQSPQ